MKRNKRKFDVLRNQILRQLKKGEKTVNELATVIKTNWRTIDNHITFLVGKGKVEPVIQTKYVRIYRLAKEVKK